MMTATTPGLSNATLDLAELDAIENITAVRLDVTKQEQIDAVVALIRENGTGLYGLVNNAGVQIEKKVTTSTDDDWDLVIVNDGSKDNTGNIYKGRVQRVLPGMQAAFVDIGLNQRNISDDDRQKVVVIMSNPTGKGGNRFKLAGPLKFVFSFDRF